MGGNLGDRKLNLQNACRLIEKYAGEIVSKSSIYETKPWGKSDQPDYLNMVIEIKCNHSASELLRTCLEIEKELGRVRYEKWGERTMDIDILFYGNEILNTPDLNIPHPLLHERKYTLVPLCEIANDLKHPAIGKTIIDLLNECQDPLEVEKLIG